MLYSRMNVLFTLRTLLNAIVCCLQLNTGRGMDVNLKVDYLGIDACWIAVYVLCRNAQMNLIVDTIAHTCMLYALINCQLPSCNLFTQHVSILLWRDTTSELWTPVHSFTLIKQPQTANYSFFILCNLILIFHTIRLILCFQQARKIDTLPVSLGQISLIVLCAGSTSAPDSLVLRRAIFRHQQPSEVISCSYWSD
jgi:hypothetical protein